MNWSFKQNSIANKHSGSNSKLDTRCSHHPWRSQLTYTPRYFQNSERYWQIHWHRGNIEDRVFGARIYEIANPYLSSTVSSPSPFSLSLSLGSRHQNLDSNILGHLCSPKDPGQTLCVFLVGPCFSPKQWEVLSMVRGHTQPSPNISLVYPTIRRSPLPMLLGAGPPQLKQQPIRAQSSLLSLYAVHQGERREKIALCCFLFCQWCWAKFKEPN